MDIVSLERLVRPQTRLVWIELPGSTTMEVSDIPAIVAFAHRRGILTGCDKTWASPLLLLKPLDLGVDMVAEAITKYIGGHSDLLLGSMTFRSVELCATVRRTLPALGIGVSPDDCALALREFETMPVRMERVLAASPRILRPGWRRLTPLRRFTIRHCLAPPVTMSGGAIFGVVPASLGQAEVPWGLDTVDAALSDLSMFAIGSSWGGTRSLIAPMQLGEDQYGCRSIRMPSIWRISIGLENPDELWADLENLLTRMNELRQR